MSPAVSGRRDPPTVIRAEPAPDTGMLGVKIFLLSLGVLFAASYVAYLVVRSRAEDWRPPGDAGLPAVLWVSTALLAAVSASVQGALAAIRRGRGDRLRLGLSLALVAALAFIAGQAWGWAEFRTTVSLYEHSLYAFTFYMLTGLHGLHVIGGVIALGWVLFRAQRGDYSRAHHPGVRYAALYWHFLGVVWLIVFGTLWLEG